MFSESLEQIIQLQIKSKGTNNQRKIKIAKKRLIVQVKISFHVIHIHTQVLNSKVISFYLSLCHNHYISISIVIEIFYTARHEPRAFYV